MDQTADVPEESGTVIAEGISLSEALQWITTKEAQIRNGGGMPVIMGNTDHAISLWDEQDSSVEYVICTDLQPAHPIYTITRV